MVNLKRMIIIALSLVIIGGIGSFFLTMDRNPLQQSTSVDASNVAAIEVRLDNGSLNMRKSDESNIRVELTGESSNQSKVQLRVEEVNGTLRIETIREKTIFNLFSRVKNLRLTVYVPEKQYDFLHVDIENGSFVAEQLQTNKIETTANNGTVKMTNIAADLITAEANNGGIILDHVLGEVIGKTTNGSISMITEHLDRNIDMETNNGSIKLETEQTPTNAMLDLRTINGKVTVFGSRDWNAAVGNGSNLIKLRTNNGSINIINSKP